MIPAHCVFGHGAPPAPMISADIANINLRTIANAAGYAGAGNCIITIAAGIEVYSSGVGTPAIIPGNWPAGVTVKLVNLGIISGAGGAGGHAFAVGCGSHPGQAGGTALDASGVSGFTFQVDNLGGTIRGGGGGGGGGSDATVTICCSGYSVGSGGGGGGQGRAGGNGGGGNPSGAPGATNGGNGGNGSSSAPGAAGTPGQYGCTLANDAGAGGAWGTVGGAGAGSNVGGAAGNAVNGNSHITWINNGTRTGPIV